jgi:hypothetical protein
MRRSTDSEVSSRTTYLLLSSSRKSHALSSTRSPRAAMPRRDATIPPWIIRVLRSMRASQRDLLLGASRWWLPANPRHVRNARVSRTRIRHGRMATRALAARPQLLDVASIMEVEFLPPLHASSPIRTIAITPRAVPPPHR